MAEPAVERLIIHLPSSLPFHAIVKAPLGPARFQYRARNSLHFSAPARGPGRKSRGAGTRVKRPRGCGLYLTPGENDRTRDLLRAALPVAGWPSQPASRIRGCTSMFSRRLRRYPRSPNCDPIARGSKAAAEPRDRTARSAPSLARSLRICLPFAGTADAVFT